MKKTNILLITTDQQRYDTIAALGYDFMETPGLDLLAADGCRYSHAYSSNPVCMAARHNIITGLPAKYHGFDDNYFEDSPRVIPYDLPTFPQLLSDGGYDTIAVGKMHFQPCRRHNGFTKMELMEEIPRHLQDDDYTQYLKNSGLGNVQSIHGVRHLLYMLPQRSLIDEAHHGSSWVAQRSIHYIKENGGKRPFFLWSSFIAPHPPFDVPDKWADLYKGKALPPIIKAKTPISQLAQENRYIADYPNEACLRRARELYYASISFVDYNIGKIIQALKDTGEYDNTLILFTSDHGEMLGDHGTFQKFLPYEGSTKIPFIAKFPGGVKAGEADSRFVDLNDILPTVLDVADITYPGPVKLPGESILQENGSKNREVQYIEYGHGSRRWVSLRDKHYKYTYYYGGGNEELFDMVEDADETENLLYGIPDKPASKARDRLKTQLIEMEAQYGLDGYVKNGQFVPLDEYKQLFYRENNPPMFPENQTGIYLSLEDEIKKAIAKEQVVNADELDLQYYEERGTLCREKLIQKTAAK